MSRRSLSPSAGAPEAKRQKLEGLTPEDYKHGMMLAPMVRSGALPTRLFALKHGAKLVWGPEIVDKAILHAKREVDPVTGVVNYNGVSKAMFTTHPLEKPHFIYQIGSSNPDLAVQAALTVVEDVSGIDLNCGCPKPFSTHSGMGAALLSTPDLLCDILVALRKALPEHISVSCKIRLMPTQEETFALVRKILSTGAIRCLTVHCRTRAMRKNERAVKERLRAVVDFVRGMGSDIAVIENGDCVGYEDARKILTMTGADSTMIATAAESNPTVFSHNPLLDVEQTLVPDYVRLGKYLGNHWSSTKLCIAQFKSSRSPSFSKSQAQAIKQAISKAKGYDDMNDLVNNEWNGKEVYEDIKRSVKSRNGKDGGVVLEPAVEESDSEVVIAQGVDGDVVVEENLVEEGVMKSGEQQEVRDAAVDAQREEMHKIADSLPSPEPVLSSESPSLITPKDWRGNPDPKVVHGAPGVPSASVPMKMKLDMPALVEGRDVDLDTPTPPQKSLKTALSA